MRFKLKSEFIARGIIFICAKAWTAYREGKKMGSEMPTNEDLGTLEFLVSTIVQSLLAHRGEG